MTAAPGRAGRGTGDWAGCHLPPAAGRRSPCAVAEVEDAIEIVPLVVAQPVGALVAVVVVLEHRRHAIAVDVRQPVRADLDGARVIDRQLERPRRLGRPVGWEVIGGEQEALPAPRRYHAMSAVAWSCDSQFAVIVVAGSSRQVRYTDGVSCLANIATANPVQAVAASRAAAAKIQRLVVVMGAAGGLACRG